MAGSTATLARKAIIFKEAARLFREKGYSGSTFCELVKRFGVKDEGIYHHFTLKLEILLMIMAYTMIKLTPKVQIEIKDETNPLVKFRNTIKFYIKYHVIDAEVRSLEVHNYKKVVKIKQICKYIYKIIMLEGIGKGSFLSMRLLIFT